MPAIIMHAGAGVLLIIMTNFASPKANNKIKITNHKTKQNQRSPLPHISTSQTSTTQNQLPKAISQQTRPAPYNKLTLETQYFQMRKMDQT